MDARKTSQNVKKSVCVAFGERASGVGGPHWEICVAHFSINTQVRKVCDFSSKLRPKLLTKFVKDFPRKLIHIIEKPIVGFPANKRLLQPVDESSIFGRAFEKLL